MIHNIKELGRQGPIIATAASPEGDILALLGADGRISVLPLRGSTKGGLKCKDLVILDVRLAKQEVSSASALRFRLNSTGQLELFAIDNKGSILRKSFQALGSSGVGQVP